MIHINPSTETVTEIQETPLSEIPKIVARTRSTIKSWTALTITERVGLLRKHNQAVERKKVVLKEAITFDMGKPLKFAEAEVARVITSAEFMLDRAEEWLKPEPRDCGVLRYDPMGLAAAITPWNAPLAIPMFQIIPSLIAGNPVVWKPSEYSPQTSKLYFEALSEFLPENLVSLVIGDKEQGKTLLEETFEFISFTGSTATGRFIAQQSARNFTRLQLELGGVDAALVLKDVDIKQAAESIVKINASNTGQICCSIKRVYVEEAVAAEFLKYAIEASKNVTVGDPTKDVDMGPLASKMQLDKCEYYLKDAIERGATLHSGGQRLTEKGFFFPHTVLSNLAPETKLLSEEAFSPILPIISVNSAEAAVELANALPVALTASIWGKDDNRMQKLAAKLDGGVIGLNRHGVPPVGCPWGGARQSGIGRSRSIEGLRECCNLKFVY